MLRKRSSRPKKVRTAFDEARTQRLPEMLRRSPREFGKQTSPWALALATEVSSEESTTEEWVSAQTVRAKWLPTKR